VVEVMVGVGRLVLVLVLAMRGWEWEWEWEWVRVGWWVGRAIRRMKGMSVMIRGGRRGVGRGVLGGARDGSFGGLLAFVAVAV